MRADTQNTKENGFNLFQNTFLGYYFHDKARDKILGSYTIQ